MKPAPTLRGLLAAGALALASGCATVPPGQAPAAANPVDPWENWNRKVFAFNEAVDRTVLEPVARTYRDVVPQMLRTGVSNFFGNIGDVWSTANHFLQGKVDYDCTPWGNPLRNVFGWQKPCYLMADAGYAATYKELLETTDWDAYGHSSGNPKCVNCMTHCGFEPSAVRDGFSSWARFFALVRDFASIQGARKAQRAYPRAPGKSYDEALSAASGNAAPRA